MTFADLLSDYSLRFPRHGAFELRPGESMRARCRAAAVPNSPGVYLIDGRTGGAWVLCYIGKAGTLR
jgi:hypothetical protein